MRDDLYTAGRQSYGLSTSALVSVDAETFLHFSKLCEYCRSSFLVTLIDDRSISTDLIERMTGRVAMLGKTLSVTIALQSTAMAVPTVSSLLEELDCSYIEKLVLLKILPSFLLLERWKVFHSSQDIVELSRCSDALELIIRFIQKDGARLCASFEHILESDPARLYSLMSDDSKHLYRLRVVELASSRGTAAEQIAFEALSRASQKTSLDDLHIGLSLFEKRSFSKFSDKDPDKALGIAYRRFLYVLAHFSIALAAGIICYTCVAFQLGALFAVGVSGLYAIAAVECSHALVRIFIGAVSKEKIEFSMDYVKSGIPESSRTIIAVPTLLRSKESIKQTIKNSERNFIVSNDTSVNIVILADYEDSQSPEVSDCEREVLSYADSLIDELNSKYPPKGRIPSFMLFHRERTLCERDGEWRGYERKRGKLEDLNKTISGAHASLRSSQLESSRLIDAKYVVAIDEDCILLYNAVQNLVGTLNHPLNKAELGQNAQGAFLKSGVAAVTPAIMTAAESTAGYKWPSLVSGATIDVRSKARFKYRSAIHDWLGVEPNRGKLAYDARAALALSRGKYAEGVVLSHDTIDGALVESIHCSSAVVAERAPASLLAVLMRSHRWIRGDLQNAFFYALTMSNPLGISRFWQSFIVLQVLSHLSTIALVALLVLSAFLPSEAGAQLLALCVIAVAAPSVVGILINALKSSGAGYAAKGTAVSAANVLVLSIAKISLSVPYALLTLHALLITAWNIARNRKLLSWSSSASVDASIHRLHLARALAILGSVIPLLILAVGAMGGLIDVSWIPLFLILSASGPILLFAGKRKAS